MRLLATNPGACRLALALTLAALAFGGTALAGEAPADAFRPPLLAPPAALPSTAPAFQAAIDIETGLLRRPTAAERIELAGLAREATGLRRAFAASELRHADGSVSLPVDPALFSATIVVIDADGKAHYGCTDAGHLHHPITVTAPAVEER